MSQEPKKLYRSEKQRVFLGVCGGISEYFGIDPVLIRVIFVLLALMSGTGVILYVAMALIVPTESDVKKTKK